jgi:hypothetical protein
VPLPVQIGDLEDDLVRVLDPVPEAMCALPREQTFYERSGGPFCAQ